MRFFSVILFFLVFALLCVASCSKSGYGNSNGSSKACNVQWQDTLTLTSGEDVSYSAGVSGTGGVINSVTYLDSTGMKMVNNPSLPWSKIVFLKAGTQASLSAQGFASPGGKLVISISINGMQQGTECDY
jgi:hypothetical protein